MPTPRSARSQCPTERKASAHDIEMEKSTTPYPMFYSNLLAGRATGVSTSTSPGQTAQAQQGIYTYEYIQHAMLTWICALNSVLLLQLFRMMKPKFHREI